MMKIINKGNYSIGIKIPKNYRFCKIWTGKKRTPVKNPNNIDKIYFFYYKIFY